MEVIHFLKGLVFSKYRVP